MKVEAAAIGRSYPGLDARLAIELCDVTKSYTRGTSTTRVLDQVELCIERGECAFLVGPSGSGKSTLLSIIGCVLSADAGEVCVLGRDVGSLSRAEAADLRLRQIGFVFQRFHLIRGLSVVENVAVPLRLAGWDKTAAERRARELLADVGLGPQWRHQTSQLSVGQCQRVAFARALAADPDLILADEPTASLDAETGQQALGLLRRLTTDAGKTVIIVTHDPRILPFADRILHLENGRVEEQPSPPRKEQRPLTSCDGQSLARLR